MNKIVLLLGLIFCLGFVFSGSLVTESGDLVSYDLNGYKTITENVCHGEAVDENTCVDIEKFRLVERCHLETKSRVIDVNTFVEDLNDWVLIPTTEYWDENVCEMINEPYTEQFCYNKPSTRSVCEQKSKQVPVYVKRVLATSYVDDSTGRGVLDVNSITRADDYQTKSTAYKPAWGNPLKKLKDANAYWIGTDLNYKAFPQYEVVTDKNKQYLSLEPRMATSEQLAYMITSMINCWISQPTDGAKRTCILNILNS